MRRIGAATSLFDDQFLPQNEPRRCREGQDPFDHYMTTGWREGRDPSQLSRPCYYKDKYLDPSQSAVNPLVHYSALSIDQRRVTATRSMTDFVEVQRRIIRDYFVAEFYVRSYDLRNVADPLGQLPTPAAGRRSRAQMRTSSRWNHAPQPAPEHSRLPPFYHYISTYHLLGGNQAALEDCRTRDGGGYARR